MTIDIIEVAKTCGFRRQVRAVGGGYTGDLKCSEHALEFFYRAAFNEGLDAAAGICKRFGDREMHPHECATAIRTLEMKP